MKSTRMFILFVSIFFIVSNIFSQREDILEQMRTVTHKPIVHLSKETLSNDAILNDILNRTSKRNLLSTSEVVDSTIATYSDGSIRKHKYGFDSNGKMTSELLDEWDGTNWVNFMRWTFAYDSNENITSDFAEYWDGTNWVNNSRYTYTYDTNGNTTSDMYEYWYHDNWEKNWKVTYTYDSNGKMTSYLREDWDGTNWEYYFRRTYTYDSNGNMTLYLYENQYGTDYRRTYTYDSNGNRTSSLREDWNEGNPLNSAHWENSWQYFYTYDSNGIRTSYLREDWDGTSWVISYRATDAYDSNGNRILLIIEDWNGANWVISSRTTYTYDSNGNTTFYLYEEWDGANWLNSWRYTYTYDSNGNMTFSLYEEWDAVNWGLGNGGLSFIDSFGNNYTIYGGEIKLFYKTITEVKDNEFGISDFSLSQNYPNPFNPSTTISYSIPQSSLVQLSVYDILGGKAAVLVNKEQASGNYKIEFNASFLTSGIYFYRLQSAGFTETKKLILLR